MIWSAKEGKATELMKWKADDGLRSLHAAEEEMTNAAVSGGSGGDGDV